jgi:hypothetical protein
VNDNHSELIKLVEIISDEKLAGSLIRAGAKFLPNNDYLSFSAAVFEKIADGKIQPALGVPLLYAGDKEGVLAVNHNDRRIADILPKVLPHYADNPQDSNYIQKIISGKAKKEHIDWYSSQGLTPAQVIEVVATESVKYDQGSTSMQQALSKHADEVLPASAMNTRTTSSIKWFTVVTLLLAMMVLLWIVMKYRK